VGDHVRARGKGHDGWGRGCYGAVIAEDNGNGTFTLDWDDGYQEDRVKPQEMIFKPQEDVFFDTEDKKRRYRATDVYARVWLGAHFLLSRQE